MRVLLVYPETPDTFWTFRHALRLVSKRAAFPPLGLLTVAAMLPRDWELRLVDLNVEHLSDEAILWADFVMLSAMLIQRRSVADVAMRCARAGRPLIAGGPLFTSAPARTDSIPHFVIGEAETLIPELVADMIAGTVRPIYEASDRPEITHVPPPRWDLITLDHYQSMAVQFSRGCPYDCEFCDIVAMNGRVPRTKLSSQLVAEVEELRALGWNSGIFIVDDNFIGNKGKAKELLRELVSWRERTDARCTFLTEASINLAQDADLLALMTAAGFRKVFIGIETPLLESLRECQKHHNTRDDLLSSVRTIQRAGIEVMGGFIVGFDNDPHDIFTRQFEFIQRAGVATAMVGLLTALPETRLYKRLIGEGRIEAESYGDNTVASLNFRTRLDRDFLIAGYRDLMNRLYAPHVYYQRVRVFLDHHRPKPGGTGFTRRDVLALTRSLWLLGVRHKGRRAYWRLFWSTLLRRPHQFHDAIELAIQGYHLRRVAATL